MISPSSTTNRAMITNNTSKMNFIKVFKHLCQEILNNAGTINSNLTIQTTINQERLTRKDKFSLNNITQSPHMQFLDRMISTLNFCQINNLLSILLDTLFTNFRVIVRRNLSKLPVSNNSNSNLFSLALSFIFRWRFHLWCLNGCVKVKSCTIHSINKIILLVLNFTILFLQSSISNSQF